MTEQLNVRSCISIIAVSLSVSVCQFANAQDSTVENTSRRAPADFKSRNFLVHTDLAKEDAEALLKKMETMLRIISRYWGAPSRKTIECFVVDDLENWSAAALPAEARPIVQGGGITIARGTRRGNVYNLNAIVYASAKFGTAQHEAVHAYCYQTFGSAGPTWYAEGMAEMGNYWKDGDETVSAPEYVIQFLKRSEQQELDVITDNRQRTGDGWKNYAWRWALCHFLVNNRNYTERFRQLGVNLLTKKAGAFSRTFATKMPELEFEFNFFVDHLQQGFNVSRCTWDWRKRFRELKGTRPAASKIRADRGWQASGLKVIEGNEYTIETVGTWMTTEEVEVTAAGHPSGDGKLVGVVFSDYQLGTPFEIGENGTFTAPSDGNLMLRCQDKWNELEDNSGAISVKIYAAKEEKSSE